MRGKPTHHSDKGPTAIEAEGAMQAYLYHPAMTKPMRDQITVDTLLAKFKVSRKTAQYRLMLAQASWATRND